MRFDPSVHLNEFIYVGDLHTKKDNLEESTKFIKWIAGLAKERQCPILFSGDQYNDFSIARVEIAYFYKWAFDFIGSPCIALVGNHDANPDMSLNFMDTHQHKVLVVNKPTKLNNGNILLLPFYRKKELFEHQVKEFTGQYIYCHQEWNGAKYENGFYAPHGVELEIIPETVKEVTSGHIHKEQAFGKVWYPGSPRHLTRSDLGEEKGVWHINLDSNTKTKILTPHDVCEPFKHFEITPDSVWTTDDLNSSRVFVDIKGPKKFIKSILKKMPETAKIRTFEDSEVVESEIKESEGIPKAFLGYVMDYANKNNLGNAEVKAILSNIYTKCPTLRSGTNE